MTNDHDSHSKNYETLIRKAYNCEKGRKHGADSKLFIDLARLESEDYTSINYKWRFQKLKKYLNYALSKLRKRRQYLESEKEFSPIQFKLDSATEVNDLANIANLGLAKIIEYENGQRKNI